MGNAPAKRSTLVGPRLVLEALYRFLPGIAMAVAGFSIVVTVAQVASLRSTPEPVAVARPVASAPPKAAPVATATLEPAPTASPPAATAPLLVPPAPTAPPPPAATLAASPPTGSTVRLQGTVLQRGDQVDYWFLIREPGREGFFRQGPAAVDVDGSFLYLLSLIPLDSGPDSVTLAAIPKDVSTIWLRQAISTGTWLPVVEVQPSNGITFLSEVRLAGA
jgi:hypothetical protein